MYYVGECLTIDNMWMGDEYNICCVCQFSWCKYYYHA